MPISRSTAVLIDALKVVQQALAAYRDSKLDCGDMEELKYMVVDHALDVFDKGPSDATGEVIENANALIALYKTRLPKE